MWRKLLGPCQPSVFLARLGKAAKQVRWNHGRKKGQYRADVVQKKVVLWNSKPLIFTPKISIRRHNARHFFEMLECRIYMNLPRLSGGRAPCSSGDFPLPSLTGGYIFATKTTRSPAPRVLREIVCLGNGIATVGMPGIPTKSWEYHPLTNGKSTWESIIKECDVYYCYFATSANPS